MHKFLFAVDGSKRCSDTIAAVARILASPPDSEILLYHCVQNLVSPYHGALEDVPAKYAVPEKAREEMGSAVLEQSRGLLVANGFPQERIFSRLKVNVDDPAMDIVTEAKNEGAAAIVVGRRGLSRVESLLIGSVSSRVAQYSGAIPVWIVDAPLHAAQNVLVAVQGVPGGRMLNRYAAETISLLPYTGFTFIHVMPPMPPYLWDDGHILDAAERSQRDAQIEKWESNYRKQFEDVMAEGKEALAARGMDPANITARVEPVKTGIARDLLDEIGREKHQMVLIGKKSLQKKTPFLLGSLANKLLHNAQGVILCLVGSE